MKRVVTEKYFTNCPNCGGTSSPDERTCPYCGTQKVYERSVETTDSYHLDRTPVDFESKADVSEANPVTTVFIVFWCICTLTMTFLFAQAGGLMMVFPLGMTIFGLVLLFDNINKTKKYREAVDSGVYYDAVVLDHQVYTEQRGSDDDRHTVTLAKIKVLASINGSEKVILIKVGDPQNAAKYPEGSRIRVAGSGDYFVIVQKPAL